MATNKPFDVRIVNPLERPTSNDFNLAQAVARGAVESLASAIYNPGGLFPYAGFIGRGFNPVVSGGLEVALTAGLGFQYYASSTFLNMGEVVGVSDIDSPHMLPVLLQFGRTITVPPAPTTAATCRRDAIAVRAGPFNTDQTATDRFNPTAQVFSPAMVDKTSTYALDDVPVTYLTAGQVPPDDSYILYITGNEVAYADEDTFANFSATPSIPDRFMPVAYINVPVGTTQIYFTNIIDARRLLFPGMDTNLIFRFTGGAAEVASVLTPGVHLSGVSTTYPAGLRFEPTVSRVVGEAPTNKYRITIPLGATDTMTYRANGQAGLTGYITTPVNIGGDPFAELGLSCSVAIAATNLSSAEIEDLTDINITANPIPSGRVAVGQPALLAFVTMAVNKVVNWDATLQTYLDSTATAFAISGGAGVPTADVQATINLRRVG